MRLVWQKHNNINKMELEIVQKIVFSLSGLFLPFIHAKHVKLVSIIQPRIGRLSLMRKKLVIILVYTQISCSIKL